MLERMTLAGCGVLHGSFQDRNLPERQGYRYCIVQVDQGHGDRLESEIPYLLDHSTREFVFCSVRSVNPTSSCPRGQRLQSSANLSAAGRTHFWQR